MCHISTSKGANPDGATIQQMLMPEQVANDDRTVLIRLMSLENPVVIPA